MTCLICFSKVIGLRFYDGINRIFRIKRYNHTIGRCIIFCQIYSAAYFLRIQIIACRKNIGKIGGFISFVQILYIISKIDGVCGAVAEAAFQFYSQRSVLGIKIGALIEGRRNKRLHKARWLYKFVENNHYFIAVEMKRFVGRRYSFYFGRGIIFFASLRHAFVGAAELKDCRKQQDNPSKS